MILVYTLILERVEYNKKKKSDHICKTNKKFALKLLTVGCFAASVALAVA
jgi:hypothetical protein